MSIFAYAIVPRTPPKLVYVEDILDIIMHKYDDDELRRVLLDDEWFSKFVQNVYHWAIRENKPLTTEQARITMRILHKVRDVCVHNGWASDADFTRLVDRPLYRHPLTQSANIPREVRHLGRNLLGFRFKRNDVIINELRKDAVRRSSSTAPTWDWINRIWYVPLTTASLDSVMDIIGQHRFDYDDSVAEGLAAVTNLRGEPLRFSIEGDQIVAEVSDKHVAQEWLQTSLKGTYRSFTEIVLPASTSSARQIMRAKALYPDTEIAPEIVAMAEAGLVTEEDVRDLKPGAAALVQDLLDFDLRAVAAIENKALVSYRSDVWLTPVLRAARRSGITDIAFAVPQMLNGGQEPNFSSAKKQAEAEGFRVHILKRQGMGLPEDSEVPRHALLIAFCINATDAKSAPLWLEFERTIVVASERGNSIPIYHRMPTLMSVFNNEKGELNHRNTTTREIAFLFNISYAMSRRS